MKKITRHVRHAFGCTGVDADFEQIGVKNDIVSDGATLGDGTCCRLLSRFDAWITFVERNVIYVDVWRLVS